MVNLSAGGMRSLGLSGRRWKSSLASKPSLILLDQNVFAEQMWYSASLYYGAQSDV